MSVRDTKGLVAAERYTAEFSSSTGKGFELAVVAQLTHRPSATCQAVHTLFHRGTVKCPTPRTPDRTILPGSQPFTVLHTVLRCPAKLCNGYAGAIAVLQGKVLSDVGISDTSKATVEQVEQSLSP